MADLIKSIQYKDVCYTFLFREIDTPNSKKYFVIVFDEWHQKVVFEMKENVYGDWKIVPPIPEWVFPLENYLSLFLKESV